MLKRKQKVDKHNCEEDEENYNDGANENRKKLW